jgi:hypothetical protein
MKLLVIASLILGLLTGCAGYKDFENTQLSNPGNALLYVYRTKADNPGRQPLAHSYPEVFANGKSLGLLEHRTYLVKELPPGTYQLKFTGLTNAARWKQRDIESQITLAPGETRYLKLRVDFDLNQMNIGQPGPKYRIFATPVSVNDAQYEIRETKPMG